MPFIEIENAKLHYLDQGGGNTVLVFGHGTLISSNIWRDFYFPLLPLDWRALALDFRGHGASNAVGSGCNFVRLAEDAANLVSRLNIGRIVYVGLSMGGGVGLQLALSHPELLKGLVLISPVTGLGPLGNPVFLRFGKYMAGKRWLLRMGMKMAASQNTDSEALDRVVDEAMLVRRETLAEYLSPHNVIEGAARLSQLELPVLLLAGLKDKVIPVKQQIRLSRTLPRCQFLTYPDHGHALCAEAPEAIMHNIRQFVQGLKD